MKLLIEIPEHVYLHAIEKTEDSRDEFDVMRAIANGTQQKMGQWIEHFDEIGKWYECDQCHTNWGGSVNFCPNCGTKMEVEKWQVKN